jgi:hypothetical protein
MKNLRSLILIPVFTFLLVEIAQGQTNALGHISAEVVEAVSTDSDITTDFRIEKSIAGNLSITGFTIDMGRIHINSGNSVACNFSINSADLRDEYGNRLLVSPGVSGMVDKVSKQIVNGNQTLEISGYASINSGQPNGNYSGSYNLVLAYN